MEVESLQSREQRAERGAVRLMDTVGQGIAQELAAALHEGGQQEHRVLNVGDGVGARILGGEDAAGFFSRERIGRNGDQ